MLRGISLLNKSLLRSTAHKFGRNPTVPSRVKTTFTRFPPNKGLYDSSLEKDSCGVGLVAHLKKTASRQIVLDANEMLVRMSHRGACGCEANSGDGAGNTATLLRRIVNPLSCELELISFIYIRHPGRYARQLLSSEGIRNAWFNSRSSGLIWVWYCVHTKV
jgi:Glutamine amidotransferases class-II